MIVYTSIRSVEFCRSERRRRIRLSRSMLSGCTSGYITEHYRGIILENGAPSERYFHYRMTWWAAR